MKIKNLLALILLLLSTLACGESTVSAAPTPACTATSPAVKLDAESRPFHMGFTRWPPEATLEGIDRMNNFVNTYGDMTALHFDGGVPWPEALTDSPLPAGLMSSWQFTRDAIPAEHTLLVSITPLDMTRSKLAAYWGESDNQPLPKPWDGYSLDHADVKTAYLNYARRVVEYFHPDYLAIGIEANVAQVNAPESWEAYKQLHQFVYENLKAEYPDLPIFATFTISHMSGLDGGDQATQKNERARVVSGHRQAPAAQGDYTFEPCPAKPPGVGRKFGYNACVPRSGPPNPKRRPPRVQPAHAAR